MFDKDTFHFSTPDGTNSICLVSGEPRKVSNPVLCAEFARLITLGKVNGEVGKGTLLYKGSSVDTSSMDDELEDEDIDESDSDEVLTLTDREVTIQSTVVNMLEQGSKEHFTTNGAPRIASVREASGIKDVTTDELQKVWDTIPNTQA